MKDYIEYVSIGLTVLALLITLIVYFAHDRRRKKQEAKLNAYQWCDANSTENQYQQISDF
ncbi:hypothetical protein I6I98_17705 [Sphingobacterium multivorum]|uniref:Uncharacterized protein n=1 Tax=Sphingobacterium multivorum TaxID=28454 RepID=A0ABX7CJ49_SPHMU|nr:hypothetical protein [Sphingobacterium multivorum]QQT52097.1 hypothetical protein I6I98_17705 [Sphingobacterium multivorum]